MIYVFENDQGRVVRVKADDSRVARRALPRAGGPWNLIGMNQSGGQQGSDRRRKGRREHQY